MEVAGRLCQVCESLLDEFEELKKEINSLWSDFSFINSGFSARTDSERVIQIIHRKEAPIEEQVPVPIVCTNIS